MGSDISPERLRLGAARTSGEEGFVSICMPEAVPEPSFEDVLIVREPGGRRRVARYLGSFPNGVDAGQPRELDGVYAVDAAGTLLIDLVDDGDDSRGQFRTHHWGGLGLPDGLKTRVLERRFAGGTDDATVAFQSEGYSVLRDDIRLRLAPGDVVWHVSGSGVVIEVDRRQNSIKIESAIEEPETVSFDDIDRMEHAR